MADTAAPARTAVAGAAAIGAAVAAIVILISSHGTVARMTFGDGVLYRYVAENLTAPESQVSDDLEGHGTALRYGRIGLPALLWVTSAGRPSAMAYAQPLLMVVAAAASAAAARVLVPRYAASALVPFLGVGLLASIAGGFAEPIAIAAGLWGVVAARRGKMVPAVALLAFAIVTREHAAGIVAGLTLWFAMQRRWRDAATISLSVLPAVAWHSVVAARFGFYPLADPFLTEQTYGAGAPFVAVWRSLTQLPAGSVAVIVVHIALGVLAVARWRRGDLAVCAAMSGLLLTTAGPFVWKYIGDGVRLGTFLQVFFVLALLEWAGRRSPGRGLTDASSG